MESHSISDHSIKSHMKKLLGVLFFAMQLLPSVLSAQTEQENLKKYWNYRERFQKYFVKIGSDFGNSIPSSNRNLNTSLDCGDFGLYLSGTLTGRELCSRPKL